MICADSLELRQLLSAVAVEFAASSDNTIYQNDVDTSNGAGQFIVVGGGSRGLLKFDVAIPEGSTVIDAVLTLNVGAVAGGGSVVTTHRVTTAWGEAESDAAGNELEGASAQAFDATWLYSFFDGEQWATPGGDFGALSASTSIDGVGTYEWIGGGLIDDVQSWVDNAATNFGWLLQASGSSATAFLSKDSPGGFGPSLEVTYEAPPEPPSIVEGRLWNDINADGRRSDPLLTQLKLQAEGGNTHFNVFGGQEHWFRSGNDNRWYFLTESGTLTKWDRTSFSLTGEVVGTIDNLYYLQPSLVTENGDDVEPWLNGWTVELIDALGNVAQTTQTAGRDLNLDGFVDPDSEGGWYSFQVVGDETYTVRQVLPDGWAEGVRIEVESSNSGEKAANGLELLFAGSYYQNWGGLNERWMKGTSGGWHYITPDGLLYRWDRNAVSKSAPLNGTLVADVGTAYYNNPVPGPITQSSQTDEPKLTRIDFGNREAQVIRGRVWLDFFENGILDTHNVIPEQFVLYPLEELASGEEWFFDYVNSDWYIINVDGEARFHANVEDVDDALNGPITGPETPQLTFVETVTEPWLNGQTLELVDQKGNVVATTTSKSIDLNEDGEIQYSSERGWYEFKNVATGNYSVRLAASDSWHQTSPITVLQATAMSLDAEHRFSRTRSDFLNWGGENERWLRDGQNQWHYMLPDGSLYRWELGSNENNGGLRGNLVATLSSDFYDDLNLLTNPDITPLTVRVDDDGTSAELLFGTRRLLSDLLAEAGL